MPAELATTKPSQLKSVIHRLLIIQEHFKH